MFSSCVIPSRNFAPMGNSKDEQIAWVKAVQTYLGISTTALAKRAGLVPSTLQRPISDPNWTGMLSGRTMARIAEVAGLKPLEFPPRMRGLAEADAAPFQFDDRDAVNDNFNRAARELIKGRNGRDAWIMKSYALELAGVLPGDVLIVDMNLTPKPRDIVCAQIYDWSGTKTETIFRLFDPPYLLTHSVRTGIEKPITVDNSTVIIKGVVDMVLRSRN